ncbi:MAG: hypothetical protein ACLT8E_03985 [Akkermansia sp.]
MKPTAAACWPSWRRGILSEARQRAHNETKKVKFDGMRRRPDIGFASFV